MNNYNFSDLIGKQLEVSIKNSKYKSTTKREISNKNIDDEPLNETYYNKNIYIEVDGFIYY